MIRNLSNYQFQCYCIRTNQRTNNFLGLYLSLFLLNHKNPGYYLLLQGWNDSAVQPAKKAHELKLAKVLMVMIWQTKTLDDTSRKISSFSNVRLKNDTIRIKRLRWRYYYHLLVIPPVVSDIPNRVEQISKKFFLLMWIEQGAHSV